MDWIDVKDQPPPTGKWVHLTRNVEDASYTCTMRYYDWVDTAADCNDIGYTHWKLAEEAE